MKRIICIAVSAVFLLTVSFTVLAEGTGSTGDSTVTATPTATIAPVATITPAATTSTVIVSPSVTPCPGYPNKNTGKKAFMDKFKVATEAYKAEVEPFQMQIAGLKADLAIAEALKDTTKIESIKAQIQKLEEQIKQKKDTLMELIKSLKAVECTPKPTVVKPDVTPKPTDAQQDVDKKALMEKIETAIAAYKADVAPLQQQVESLRSDLVTALKANDTAKIQSIKEQIKKVSVQIKQKGEALKDLIKSIKGNKNDKKFSCSEKNDDKTAFDKKTADKKTFDKKIANKKAFFSFMSDKHKKGHQGRH